MVIILLMAVHPIAAGAADQATIAYVIDGDTFRLTTGERIRVANIDAPESQRGQAKCAAEIVLGRAATDRVRAMLEGRVVEIERVGRSYNRTVARVTFNGSDLAAQLIHIGVARPWPHFSPKPDWCQ